MPWINCDVCGELFYKKPRYIREDKHHYCSKKCQNKGQQRLNVIVEKEDYAEIHITKGEKLIIVLIDKDDIEKAQKVKWIAQYDKTIDNYYITGWEKDNYENRQRFRLHRFLTDCPKGHVVDHINRNTCDNRKSNLKVCTQIENANNKGWYKNNTSGYKNIRKVNKNAKKWELEIKRNKKVVLYKKGYDLQELIRLRDEFLEAEKNGTQIKEQKEENPQLKLDITGES